MFSQSNFNLNFASKQIFSFQGGSVHLKINDRKIQQPFILKQLIFNSINTFNLPLKSRQIASNYIFICFLKYLMLSHNNKFVAMMIMTMNFQLVFMQHVFIAIFAVLRGERIYFIDLLQQTL